MSLLNAGINFLLAFPLLWLNGILGKWKMHSYSVFGYSEFGFTNICEQNFSGNFFQMIVHPVIYLALVSWILQQFALDSIAYDLWLLIPFYWFLRVIYAMLWDTFVFTNWKTQIVTFVFSMLLGEGTLFSIIRPLINSQDSIFIGATAFRDAFWFAVLAYIAKWMWDVVKEQLVGEELFPSFKKSEVIIQRYSKYRRKYHKYIKYVLSKECSFKSEKQQEHFMCLVYAVMIYEAHNRPLWLRIIEYCVKFFCPFRTMSLGIMQVQTENWINSKISIYRGISKLYLAFSTAEMPRKIAAAIYDYNPSDHYYCQVISIYDELRQYLDLPTFGYHYVEVSKRNLVHQESL